MLNADMLGYMQGRRSARNGPKSLPAAPQRIRRLRSNKSCRSSHAVQPEPQSISVLHAAAATNAAAAPSKCAGHIGPPRQTPSTDTVACNPDSEPSQKSQTGIFPVPASIIHAIRLKLRQDSEHANQVETHVSMHEKPSLRQSIFWWLSRAVDACWLNLLAWPAGKPCSLGQFTLVIPMQPMLWLLHNHCVDRI